MTGLYWEEWDIGAEFVTVQRTITETDIVTLTKNIVKQLSLGPGSHQGRLSTQFLPDCFFSYIFMMTL